ncbi:MAG TPA: hypothetical protein VG893_01250 [Terracidiphilus sp.]|nr:hypothetical protein [Terracidiphilus sp.]
MAESFSTDKLLDLYKIAVEEYRFEVRLGWDRTMYFLVLNSAVLSVATGLLKLDGPPLVDIFIALLFAFGLGTSLVGSKSIAKAHEYYRRTIVRKTIIEECIGLNSRLPNIPSSLDLTIATTSGQEDRFKILSDPEKWIKRSRRIGTITFGLQLILWGMALVDCLGIIAVSVMCWHKWTHTVIVAPQHLLKLIS